MDEAARVGVGAPVSFVSLDPPATSKRLPLPLGGLFE